MNWKGFKYLGISLLALMITSCDAIINLQYEVKNATGKDLQIRVHENAYDPYSFSSNYKIVHLPKNESIIVGSKQSIGFPWEKRSIYKSRPNCNCFTIMEGNMPVDLDILGVKWKFKRGSSVLKLKNKHLINP